MAVAEDTGYDAEFAWAEPVVRADGVDFFYGEGQARFQVLFDNRPLGLRQDHDADADRCAALAAAGPD
jgi:hypothetical protein